MAIGLALAAIVILLALQAFSGQKPSGAGQQGGQLAPDFTLKDINGREFSLSDFRGKVVILDFFATYCAPCKEQVKELRELRERFGEKLVIISISVYPGDTDKVLRDYARENGMDWIVARDTADVASKYGVRRLPTLVVVDPKGYIKAKHVGLTDSEVLAKDVEAALGRS